MKHLCLTFCLFAALFVSAEDNSEIVEYKINVQDFSELTVVDGVRVDYKALPDSAGMAVFSCSSDMASNIMFSNKKNKLTIETSADEAPLVGVPLVRVYSNTLRAVVNSGDSLTRLVSVAPISYMKIQEMGNGRVEAYGIETQSVDASVDTGNGTVVVTGNTHKASLRNVGTGEVDATKLITDEAKVFIFGPGPVDCNVKDHITVYGMGSGRVRSHNANAKISRRSIGVKIEKCETDSIQ